MRDCSLNGEGGIGGFKTSLERGERKRGGGEDGSKGGEEIEGHCASTLHLQIPEQGLNLNRS